jgi:MFS family permease
MLPTTIAIVSAAYPGAERGRALGTMGGAAAIAAGFGPVIGGVLTATLGWRSVLLINAPLAVLAVAATLRSVPADPPRTEPAHIDLRGTVLLSICLIGLVFGLAQSQVWGWTSAGVLLPLAASVVAVAGFVVVERRTADPLLEFGLLRRYPNYLGSTVSQGIAGMAEMGLGLLFPLLLILNLRMDPGLAGLALIPTTLPMVAVAPLAGRWYAVRRRGIRAGRERTDRAGRLIASSADQRSAGCVRARPGTSAPVGRRTIAAVSGGGPGCRAGRRRRASGG